MIESILLVLYTATIFLVFRWWAKNDGKPGIADQTGPFSIGGKQGPAHPGAGSGQRSGVDLDGRARRTGETDTAGAKRARQRKRSRWATDATMPAPSHSRRARMKD